MRPSVVSRARACVYRVAYARVHTDLYVRVSNGWRMVQVQIFIWFHMRCDVRFASNFLLRSQSHSRLFSSSFFAHLHPLQPAYSHNGFSIFVSTLIKNAWASAWCNEVRVELVGRAWLVTRTFHSTHTLQIRPFQLNTPPGVRTPAGTYTFCRFIWKMQYIIQCVCRANAVDCSIYLIPACDTQRRHIGRQQHIPEMGRQKQRAYFCCAMTCRFKNKPT